MKSNVQVRVRKAKVQADLIDSAVTGLKKIASLVNCGVVADSDKINFTELMEHCVKGVQEFVELAETTKRDYDKTTIMAEEGFEKIAKIIGLNDVTIGDYSGHSFEGGIQACVEGVEELKNWKAGGGEEVIELARRGFKSIADSIGAGFCEGKDSRFWWQNISYITDCVKNSVAKYKSSLNLASDGFKRISKQIGTNFSNSVAIDGWRSAIDELCEVCEFHGLTVIGSGVIDKKGKSKGEEGRCEEAIELRRLVETISDRHDNLYNAVAVAIGLEPDKTPLDRDECIVLEAVTEGIADIKGERYPIEYCFDASFEESVRLKKEVRRIKKKLSTAKRIIKAITEELTL